jgi:hypothetical protein
MDFFSTSGGKVTSRYNKTDKMVHFWFKDSLNRVILSYKLPIPCGVLYRNFHVSTSFDTSIGAIKVILNGIDVSESITIITNDNWTIDFATTEPYYIGYGANGIIKGNMGELYFDTVYMPLDTYNPFWDSEANRPIPVRKAMETLGSNPLICMPISADNPTKNYGSGGDSSRSTASSDVSTSPWMHFDSTSAWNSPHSIAGKSNSLGNASTDSTSGASSASRDTAFMSYRGIENFYGNCQTWVDGYNIGIVADRDNFVSNNDAHFADNTSTNYIKIGTTNPTANGFVSNIQDIAGAFIPSSSTGGSSSTFITDNYLQNTGNRVAAFSGDASDGSDAGAFFWRLALSSSGASRNVGCRLSF